jgi:hypothetical protein
LASQSSAPAAMVRREPAPRRLDEEFVFIERLL